jgi:hypothetical protein
MSEYICEKCGIQDVIVSNEKITFKTGDGDIILEAFGECCSSSWFEIPPDTDLSQCIGKIYEGYFMTDEESIDWGEDKTYFYDLSFRNITKDEGEEEETILKIIMKNKSNGYYCGYIEESRTLVNSSPLECRKNQLLIVTGLPGCGKTSFAKKLLAEGKTEGILLDDVNIGSLNTIINIRNNLRNGLRVIIATPLFCNYSVYSKFEDKLQLTDPLQQIRIYCFDPNSEQAIINLTKREPPEILRSYIISVNNYKNNYTTFDEDLENKFILPTFESEDYF